jgi:hypothetical protein
LPARIIASVDGSLQCIDKGAEVIHIRPSSAWMGGLDIVAHALPAVLVAA